MSAASPYLTSGVGRLLPSAEAVPECNHKVTGNSYKAVNGCEAVVGCEAKTSTKALVTCSKSALTGLVSS